MKGVQVAGLFSTQGERSLRKYLISLCAAAVLGGSALTSSLTSAHAAALSLTGAGSTFAGPFFTKAFEAYKGKYGADVNYQLIGSGGGIKAFTAKTVDFGATDVPMNPTTELPAAVAAGGPVLQVPITIGGVSVAYNIPGVKTGLHLSGRVLAQIYLGTITKWNDHAIKALNPKVKLPATQIVAVHRSDSSGTSYAFTDYLAQVSAQWRGIVGVGKLPAWPTGLGGNGNAGVAQLVQSTPNAIGYVELAYVLQNHMKQAAILNRARQFEAPSVKTVAAAAAHLPHVSATDFSIVNAPGKNAYPIATYTWVLLFQHPSDKAAGKALKSLFTWTATTGQKYAAGLDYVTLPKNIQKLDVAMFNKIK
jgi:phosphate transport system substrate-binding protein